MNPKAACGSGRRKGVLRKYKRSWILAVPLLFAFLPSGVFSSPASAADSNQVVFAYQSATIYQDVAINTANTSSLTFTVSAAETQDWKASSDSLNIGIALYGQGGGLIYQHSTGNVTVDSSQFSDYSISIAESSVGTSGWASAKTVRVSITGQDGEFWAGNYGTRIESASLKFDDSVELLSNTEFTSNASWTSSIGWQSCSGGSGNKPCVSITVPPTTTTTTTTIPINNANYTLGTDMVWATANENGTISVSAPGGGTFSKVVFASYGTPSGSDGNYTQGWCHATNSIQKVSQAFVGNSSGTIAASNSVFGDPCGGTYKRLSVVIQYTGGLPNTTTTTTTLPPSCDNYDTITVTGRMTGAVWGSNPYTDDSNFGVAAVHAGLIAVGETAEIEPYDVEYYSSYPGSTANGITTNDWSSGWCGYKIRLVVPPTTTTTTSSTTTTTTTTTLPPSTTTSEAPQAETTTTTEPQTTTTETTSTTLPPTTTTTSTTIKPPPSVTSTTEKPLETTTTTPPPQTTTTLQIPTTTQTTELPASPSSSSSESSSGVIPAAEEIEKAETVEQLSTILSSAPAAKLEVAQLVAVITNDAFIELPKEQLKEVFAAVDITELSPEQETQLAETLTTAPDDVKQTFEGEVDIYGSGFDDYVPTGSKVDVKTRRSVIAVSTVLTTATAAAAAAGPGPSPSGGGSSGGGSGSGSGEQQKDTAARKEDEEEDEEAGGLEGPDEDEDDNDYTRNSIFIYGENGMKKFSILGFIKKFAKETAGLSFTIAGSVIMFVTLSGDTRRIAIIATVTAITVHYIYAMLENDE